MIPSARTSLGPLSIGLLGAALALGSGCAARTATEADVVPARPAPVPGWELVRELRPDFGADPVMEGRDWELAWRALQEDRLEEAYGLASLLGRRATNPVPALVLLGYVELRLGRWERAAAHFESALQVPNRTAGAEASALAGAALTALAQRRREGALERMEALHRVDRDHPVLGAFRDQLRIELADEWLGRARDLRPFDPRGARFAYEKALHYAPQAAALHLELAGVARELGDLRAAEAAARSSVRLAPDDAEGLALLGDILEQRGDRESALKVYARAERLDSNLHERRRRLSRELRLTQPPPEYFVISNDPLLTRGALAALLCLELGDLLGPAPRRPVIVTDLEESWARDFIAESLALGLQTPQPNHTFLPGAGVGSQELADTLRRALQVVASQDCSRNRDPFPELLPPAGGSVSGELGVRVVERLREWVRSCPPEAAR